MAENAGKGVVGIEADASGLAKSLEAQVAGQAGAIGSVFAKVGKSAGLAILAGVGVAAAGFGGLAAVGEKFDEAFDHIRIGTGKTGQDLKGLQTDFKTVFASVPVSMIDASASITTLNKTLGLSGKPLQDLSVQILNLSRITKTDLSTNLQTSAQVFNSWGVAAADQGTKLDELFRVSQQTGASFGTLSSEMAGSGTQLRAAGLTFEQSAGLLGLLAKNGLSASDIVPALGRAMATAAKDGKPAQQVFKDTFDAIRNAPDDTKAAGIALDVFGAKAGPKFAALIREGKLSYDDFAKSIATSGDTINAAAAQTDDWREKLHVLVNKVLVLIEPIASAAFGALTTVVGAASGAIGDFISGFTKGTDELGSAQSKWAVFGAVAYEVFNTVRTFVVDHVVPAIKLAAEWVGTHLVIAFKAVASWITGTAIPAIQLAVAWIGEHIVPAVKTAAEWVGTHLVTAFQAVASWITGTAIPAVRMAVEWIGEHIVPAVKIAAEWVGTHLVVAFQAVASWITGTAIPAIKLVAEWIGTHLVAGFKIVVGWVRDNWPQIKADVMNVFDAIKVAVLYFINTIVPAIVRAFKATFGWLMDNKEFLIGAAVTIGTYLVVLFVQWAAGALAAAAASTAAAVALALANLEFVAIGVVIAAVVGGIIYAYNHFETFRNVVDAIGRFLRDELWPALQNVFGWLRDNVPAIIQAVIDVATWLWQNVLSPFVGFLSAVWSVQVAIWKTEFDIVKTAIEAVITVGTWLWQNVLSPFVGFLSAVWSVQVAIWKTEFDIVKTAIDAVITTAMWLWQNVLSPIVDFLGAAFSVGMGVFKTLFDDGKTAVQGAVDIATWLWHNVLEPIVDFVSAAFSVGMGVFKALFSGAELAVSGVVNIATWLWHNVLEPIVDFFGAAFTVGMGVFKTLVSGAELAVGGVVNIATWLWHNVLEPIVDFFGAAFSVGMGVFKSLFSGAELAVSGVANAVTWLWHNALEPLVTYIGAGFTTGMAVIGTIFGGVGTAINGVIGFINDIISAVSSAVTWIGKLASALAAINPFAGGHGPTGAGTTTIPPAPEPGTYVPGGPVLPHAMGGPTLAGSMYQVAENGPELLHEGGRTYLLAAAAGYVTPASETAAARSGVTIEHAVFSSDLDVDGFARIMNFHLATAA